MKKKIYNSYDETYKEMWNAVFETRNRLTEATRKVILRKGVIDLYPAGTDHDKAINDCEEAKGALVCAVEDYDDKMQKLEEYFSQHYNEFDDCRTWDPARMSTSHEIVELAYEKTIRG